MYLQTSRRCAARISLDSLASDFHGLYGIRASAEFISCLIYGLVSQMQCNFFFAKRMAEGDARREI